MEIELIQKILPLDCGKTGKLVLLIMAAHLSEKQWFVKDLMEIIGGDAKTVRFALRELVDRRLVNLVGKTELQANIFELNVKEVLKYQLPYLDRDTRFALERLGRQAQQHHLPRSTRPKP